MGVWNYPVDVPYGYLFRCWWVWLHSHPQGHGVFNYMGVWNYPIDAVPLRVSLQMLVGLAPQSPTRARRFQLYGRMELSY